MKKIKGIRGIRKRWMVNSISVVLFIVLLAVTAFSAAMGSYYYSTLSESLSQKAESAVRSFNYYRTGDSYYEYARTLVGGDMGLLLAMAVLPKTVTAGVCVSAVLWIVAWWQRNDAAARPAMIAVACFAVCTLIWLSHTFRLAGLVL